jgi:hypothetical protein
MRTVSHLRYGLRGNGALGFVASRLVASVASREARCGVNGCGVCHRKNVPLAAVHPEILNGVPMWCCSEGCAHMAMRWGEGE